MIFRLLLIIGFSYLTTYAQLITTEPIFPTQNDSIVIFLDTSQPGAEELLNYSGVLYAHTGVNTNLGNWRFVKGSWGNNSTQPSLTKLGANLYKLTVGFPRTFYGVTNPAEIIQQIALVVRSSDGTKQTRPDIFIDLFNQGLNVRILSPDQDPVFVKLNDTLSVEAASINSTNLSLFVDGSLVAQTSGTSLNHDIVITSSGKKWVKAVATDSLGSTKADSFSYVVNTPVTIAPLPNGVIDGINYISSTSVVLSLYAPQKENVYVIGDFNNWEVDPAYYMKLTPDSLRWWLQIDNLIPKKEYIFQYLVDGNLRIADPYTKKVSDPWNDKFISSSTYPNLIQYPEGKTTEIASVLQTDQQPYQWKYTSFEKPKATDLVIYELLIRDFIAAHDYKTLIDTLNYLRVLGVNAIELMPVMEFEGNESWGYNTSFHMAVDKYYGPKNDLKRFIDTCHSMGIAVLLDIVLNHAYGQSPLVRLYWDAANNRPAPNNPWFNMVSPNPVFSFGFDFNHEAQVTKDYVDRVNRFWLEEYNIDGFRFDFTKGFTNVPGDGGGFDQSRINNLTRMADKIWEYDSTTIVILEHFAPNNEEKILADYGMMLWGNMNFQYSEASMGYASDLTGASYKSRGFNDPHLVAYMESHDEERMMYKNLQFGNSGTNYNIKDLSTALNRVKMAGAFYFTIPGPKMIWQFGELGYDVSINNPCRVCNKPILWNYYNDVRRKNLYKVFAALIDLKEYEAFESKNFTTTLAPYGKKINITHPTMNVAAIGNFYIAPLNVTPNFSNTGTWYNYFSGDSIEVTDLSASIPLAPGEFHIYTTVKLPTPEPGILTDIISADDNIIADDFYLEQNYPNPFNPSTEIVFQVKENTNVEIKIFDILGRDIKTLVNEEKQNGVYSVSWNGDDNFGNKVSSGIYFYKMEAGNFVQSRKMVLLK